MRRALGCAMLVLWAGVVSGNQPSEALKARQAEARRQQAEVQERISALQKEIDRQTVSRADAATALRESETAISSLNRRLDELVGQDKAVRADLASLAEKISQGRSEVKRQQAELADQLRAQYASGLSPWTALLSGEDPQQIGRELSYLAYVSQAQADAVRALDDGVKKLAKLQASRTRRQAELKALTEEAEQKKTEIEAQQAERQSVLARIEADLKQQRSQAKTLERNEKRLESLVDGLQAEIARQQEAERIAREKRAAEAARRAQLAREKANRERREAEAREARAAAERARQQAEPVRVAPEEGVVTVQAQDADAARAPEATGGKASQVATLTPPPVKPEVRAPEPEPADESEAEPVAPSGGLTKNMASPVKGEVQGRFGMARPDGGVWRGIVLRAPEGTRVRPVASGKVAYAGWFNGFGNLMVIDHGQGFLTVYAYNQSLLRQVGDVVRPSDAIATVGATGGQVESGLYFEIRQNGKPVNPQLWLKR
ncbi:MAG: peptidoglycan DD-metalloendopeptidase family protein [Pusillimonas sp.]